MDLFSYIILILVILTKRVNTKNNFKNSDHFTELEQKIKMMAEEINSLKNNYLVEDVEDDEENWHDDDGGRYEFQGQI